MDLQTNKDFADPDTPSVFGDAEPPRFPQYRAFSSGQHSNHNMNFLKYLSTSGNVYWHSNANKPLLKEKKQSFQQE